MGNGETKPPKRKRDILNWADRDISPLRPSPGQKKGKKY